MSAPSETLMPTDLTGELASPRQFHAVIEGLRGYELLDPQAPMTQYLRGRLAMLAGEEYEAPPLYVVKAEELNAFATEDAIVVHEGIFDYLDSEEEIDALLGHEFNHVIKGHVCERSGSKRKRHIGEQLGKIRSQEIEADIRTIELLDRRGVNPYGLISLLDKTAQLQDDEEPTRFHSPTHGSPMDRKVTAEQAMAIVDTKHLSPQLTALAKPAAGDPIRISSAGFISLPPAVRQGVLSNATQEVVTATHLEAQKQIIREIAEHPLDETEVEMKARLMLHAQSKARLEALVSGANELDEMLTTLDSPEVKALLESRFRRSMSQRIVEGALPIAVLDSSSTLEDMRNLAAVVSRHEVIYSATSAIAENLVAHVTPDMYQEVIVKLATVTAGTHITPVEVESVLLRDLELSGIQTVGGVESGRFVRELHEMFEHHKLTEASSYASTVERLLYAAKQDRLSGGNLEDGYHFWGLDTAVLADSKKESPAGPFARKLHRELQQMPVSIIIDELMEYYDRTGDVPTVNGAAAIAFREHNSNQASPHSSVAEDGDAVRLTDVSLLPLLIISGGNGTVSIHGMSAMRIVDEYITSKTPSREVAELMRAAKGNIAEDTAEIAIDDHVALILERLEIVRGVHSQLLSVRPELLTWTMEGLVRSSAEIKDALLFSALQQYVNHGESVQLIALLEEGIVRRMGVGEFYNTPQRLLVAQDLWKSAANLLFEQPERLETEEGMLVLAALGMSTSELELNLNVPGKVFEMLARQRDFQGGIRLIQEEFPRLTSVHGHVLSILIEEKAQTLAEFQQLEDLIDDMYEQVVDNNLGTVAVANFIDSVVIPFYANKETSIREAALKTDEVAGLQQSRLLAGLLSSGHDDRPLQEYVAERWWLEKRTTYMSGHQSVREHFSVEDYMYKRGPAKRRQLEWWLENDYPPLGSYSPFSSNMESVYLLSGPARFLAVRKLLLEGENAILHSAENVANLVDALMDSWLKAESGTEEGNNIRDLLINLLWANDISASYQHVAPMLQEMILKPPKQASPLRPITDAIATKLTDRLFAMKTRQLPVEDDYQAIRERIFRLFVANQPELISGVGESEDRRLKQLMLHFVGAVDAEAASKKLSTIAFAALAGKKSGALGVKMLQLAGQYFDLSPEDRQEFEEVYDNMKGQTRLQAYKVLKREASTSSEAKQLFDSIETFGSRIGGGSLFTFYRVRLKDGRDVALGVKNPNAEYRVAKLADFASKGLSMTIASHEEDTTLRLMDSLLADAAQWVNNELKDEDYPAKDMIFKAENDTWSGNGFRKGRSTYELVTPNTVLSGSLWIRSEEFVRGQNLTGLRIVEDGRTSVDDGVISRHDFKQLSSVIVRNYIHQVMTGSYAHSDVHPGNFRVTSDNSKVVVLDRRNLIEVTPELRATIKTAFQALVSDDTQTAIFTIAGHAHGGGEIPATLRETLRAACEQYKDDPAALMVNTLITLKREGVGVPLNLGLLLRNFMSIAQLSDQAGFDGLVEAFLHTADDSEINQLMAP